MKILSITFLFFMASGCDSLDKKKSSAPAKKCPVSAAGLDDATIQRFIFNRSTQKCEESTYVQNPGMDYSKACTQGSLTTEPLQQQYFDSAGICVNQVCCEPNAGFSYDSDSKKCVGPAGSHVDNIKNPKINCDWAKDFIAKYAAPANSDLKSFVLNSRMGKGSGPYYLYGISKTGLSSLAVQVKKNDVNELIEYLFNEKVILKDNKLFVNWSSNLEVSIIYFSCGGGASGEPAGNYQKCLSDAVTSAIQKYVSKGKPVIVVNEPAA